MQKTCQATEARVDRTEEAKRRRADGKLTHSSILSIHSIAIKV